MAITRLTTLAADGPQVDASESGLRFMFCMKSPANRHLSEKLAERSNGMEE
jgi:hypothetical protein